MILLLAAGLAVPRAAAAADMTAEERVAILGVYQMECAPLNARLKACAKARTTVVHPLERQR